MTFILAIVFICGIGIGAILGFIPGYRMGGENNRQTLIKGMDALLESEDLKIYVKKGSSFLTDGPR